MVGAFYLFEGRGSVHRRLLEALIDGTALQHMEGVAVVQGCYGSRNLSL
jgi:hypothetical protein